jgi:hypothetical protein
MWLTDIFNKLFPPPPLEPEPKQLKDKRESYRKHRKCNAILGGRRYLTEEDIDELRESLRDYTF